MAAIIIPDSYDFSENKKKMEKVSMLLGKDMDKLLEACKLLMNDELYHPRRPVNPALKHIQDDANEMGMTTMAYIHGNGWSFREAVKVYTAELDEEEKRAYANDLEAEKNFRNKLFKTIYGIASRKHIRIIWNGECRVCMPDRFDIYRGGERIAMIQC